MNIVYKDKSYNDLILFFRLVKFIKLTAQSRGKQHLKTWEDKLLTAAADKRARINKSSNSIRPETTHTCDELRNYSVHITSNSSVT